MTSHRRVQLAAAVALIAVVAGAVGLLTLGGGSSSRPVTADLPAQRTTDLRDAARAANARFISYRREYGINDHATTPVRYPTNPPTNGRHHPIPAQDGNYAGVEPPPTEQVVHALEHGRVVIQYRPGTDPATLRTLEALFEESPDHVLLVENRTQMPCRVAVTAWGEGMLCPKFTPASIDAVRAFRDAYLDKGPEPSI